MTLFEFCLIFGIDSNIYNLIVWLKKTIYTLSKWKRDSDFSYSSLVRFNSETDRYLHGFLNTNLIKIQVL